jgi:uncharacterized ferritin-like protein (DUF455 family)
VEAPLAGTFERAAWDYVTTRSLEAKLVAPPARGRFEEPPRVRRLTAPGRPPELRVVEKAKRTRSAAGPRQRAQIVHTFLHHELQAAELLAWAVLAFADAPAVFRRGLLGVCRDEVRHMGLYRGYLRDLGYDYGAFPVRDWFWQRVPACRSPAAFVATLGVGFEGANLDHTRRFAAMFRAAGDTRGAELIEQVGEEEVAHVRFAARWLARFTGAKDFDTWTAQLPPPLSPLVMRHRPLDDHARRRAGLGAAFLERLARWEPLPPGGPAK